MPTETRPGSEIAVVPISNEGELMQALAIREVVFIEEQHVPEGIERDADDARSFHVLAVKGGHAVGTGRIVPHEAPHGESGPWGKVGRMAVLQSERKGGVGSKMLLALEEEARRRKFAGIILNAQLTALGFYQRHDYQAVGEVFEEAGMPHRQMVKRL